MENKASFPSKGALVSGAARISNGTVAIVSRAVRASKGTMATRAVCARIRTMATEPGDTLTDTEAWDKSEEIPPSIIT